MGGWLNSESPKWFEQYAAFIVERYSDRVKDFITMNEPQCMINDGHRTGVHAPGNHYSDEETARVAYHMMLAHGRAVK